MSNNKDMNVEIVDDGFGPQIKVGGKVPPSNSFKNRIAKDNPPVKRVTRITKGNVVKQKKGFFKKFAEVFVGDDVTSVTSYIFYDVLIPAAKSTLSDMVSGGIEMLLFGDSNRSSRIRRDKGVSKVSYSSYYNKTDRESDRREASRQNRTRHNFDAIILD